MQVGENRTVKEITRNKRPRWKRRILDGMIDWKKKGEFKNDWEDEI